MDRHRIKPGVIIALASGLIPLLLVLGAQKETGQEKAGESGGAAKPPQTWTAESHDRTSFPLAGRHRTLACRECHVNNVFEGTPTDCEVCHWQRRQDDRYALRLGTRCGDCHTPQAWKKVDPARWSHETETGFRLEGVHRTLDCESCHADGRFTPRPTDCYSCHEADYRGTREPNHSEAGFATECRNCHSPRAWSDASFRHSGFGLQGRHAGASCSECHPNGVYAGTPTDCASCHLDDYNGATDPNHRSAGFPVDCAQCHGTSADGWSGANFSHDFPIQSGRHAGLSCSECHRSSDFRSFTCLECHAHEQSDMNDQHSGVSGYAYSSLACYGCHPRGQNRP